MALKQGQMEWERMKKARVARELNQERFYVAESHADGRHLVMDSHTGDVMAVSESKADADTIVLALNRLNAPAKPDESLKNFLQDVERITLEGSSVVCIRGVEHGNIEIAVKQGALRCVQNRIDGSVLFRGVGLYSLIKHELQAMAQQLGVS